MLKRIFILLVVLGIHLSHAQGVSSPYEVGTWRGFCTAAVSFTLDDESPNQFAKAIPIFDELGFKATLFIVTSSTWGWPPQWDLLNTLAHNGHEIASHTVTHPHLAGQPDSVQLAELQTAKEVIESHIPDYPCVTLAYPYCEPAKKSLVSQFYIAARICSGSLEPSTPRDFFNLSSIICGELGGVKTTQDFMSRFNSVKRTKGWCIFLIHGIDNDGGWSSLSSAVLKETLDSLHVHRNEIWVETFGNVVRYIKERNAVSVTELSSQDSSITIQVTDTLDNAIYNYPVTLRRPLPEGWASGKVFQNGKEVSAQILQIDAVRYIQFDVIPDQGEVVLVKTSSTGMRFQNHSMIPDFKLFQNYPNPFNATTIVEFYLPEKAEIRLALLNVQGQQIKEITKGIFPSGKHQVKIDASELSNGLYFYQLEVGNSRQFRKLVLLK